MFPVIWADYTALQAAQLVCTAPLEVPVMWKVILEAPVTEVAPLKDLITGVTASTKYE
jgi:hypothetical protein